MNPEDALRHRVSAIWYQLAVGALPAEDIARVCARLKFTEPHPTQFSSTEVEVLFDGELVGTIVYWHDKPEIDTYDARGSLLANTAGS